ncbi:hypothetical protein EHW90_09995 [Lachnoanaerobaculum orale]|jgi:hypothetical protein|uniref:Uncharacterized protein n=2 Tax=Lachnoanaerobaculum TaxID=1164882 RepID=I0R9L5_9FIRM|nr:MULTISPECIES: helix-turn-helix domain-containing protein [Lachnoanaerobaculum]EIC96373.1 hypothetical protein HMPREF9970_0049 [Lachnoanaerobaculum saburreum F0468]MBF1009753.1 helix-turn-helix domain-containing protein [Lachnoanaerobaculum sp.]RRJ17284.1 hypothetical protein EHW90_09995 [Lachnoanaerobaculum orale]
MAEINRIDYELIVSATKGNMADIGKILENFSGKIEKVIYHLAPWLPEECRKDCKQEVMIMLVQLIQTKFKV